MKNIYTFLNIVVVWIDFLLLFIEEKLIFKMIKDGVINKNITFKIHSNVTIKIVR